MGIHPATTHDHERPELRPRVGMHDHIVSSSAYSRLAPHDSQPAHRRALSTPERNAKEKRLIAPIRQCRRPPAAMLFPEFAPRVLRILLWHARFLVEITIHPSFGTLRGRFMIPSYMISEQNRLLGPAPTSDSACKDSVRSRKDRRRMKQTILCRGISVALGVAAGAATAAAGEADWPTWGRTVEQNMCIGVTSEYWIPLKKSEPAVFQPAPFAVPRLHRLRFPRTSTDATSS